MEPKDTMIEYSIFEPRYCILILFLAWIIFASYRSARDITRLGIQEESLQANHPML